MGGGRGGPERACGVEGVARGETVQVVLERGGGCEEPGADPGRRAGGGTAEVLRRDLGGPEFGDEACRGPSRTATHAGCGGDGRGAEEAGGAGRVEREESLRQRREEDAPIPGRGEESRDQAGERRHARTEQEAALRVAEAALGPGFPERGGDDDEIGHRGEDTRWG